ncbi:MAG: uroporphyrinogen-III C-methyltransferase [Spirochaetales bacterium]|nr:uroporphyrinogen-III C-methyltransferase [Spirochaetales bacterium]
MKHRGKVSLVGAGPGDPGLISVYGMDCLSRADAVVYDYLSNDELLCHCKPDCKCIYVGKQAGRHAYSQDQINEILVREAFENQYVVRLKGGDPFVFGRGGEEAMALLGKGIKFEIVPGVTAAVAGLAYAGIPLTHRGVSSEASLITGHETAGKQDSDINWELLGRSTGTLTFYMGVRNLPKIVDRLTAHGRPGDTPTAVIQWGTLNHQKTAQGTLQSIVEKCASEGISSPAIIVVGKVVALREQLRWFDNRPLSGRRVVVTRSRDSASSLSRELKRRGAAVVEFPTIEIIPFEDLGELRAAISRVGDYAWIVFTSKHSVRIFMSELANQGKDSRWLSGVMIASIGSETAKRLGERGIIPDLIPERQTSEGLLEAFTSANIGVDGMRVLIPGSELSRGVVFEGLSKKGAQPHMIPIYANRTPEYTADQIDEAFSGPPDIVTFTSSSTVKNTLSILRAHGREDLIPRLGGACIGPVTAATAAREGITICVEPTRPSIHELADSIEQFFLRKESS